MWELNYKQKSYLANVACVLTFQKLKQPLATLFCSTLLLISTVFMHQASTYILETYTQYDIIGSFAILHARSAPGSIICLLKVVKITD
jgi:hypothetical protein